MGFHKAVLWVAIGGLIALVFVTVTVAEPVFRSILAILCVTPLLYVTIRVALGSERQVAHERRKYLKLRNVTDEFLMNVRNLNRLTVAAQAHDAPVDLDAKIDQVVAQMHGLVDRIRAAAGKEEPAEGREAPESGAARPERGEGEQG